ncbi:MAG: M48 family metalloprotease [Pseudomonadota bacterium]
MEYAAMAWAGWIAWQFARMCLAALLLTPSRPVFDGFRVTIPERVRAILTPAELAAVIAHEHGHRRHLHVWSNFALVCLFRRPSTERRQRQELQADDYAIGQGHGAALASALLKLSTDPHDLARIDRITLSA